MKAWPADVNLDVGLQIGGGITVFNAQEWLDCGASKVCLHGFSCLHLINIKQVIVTSYLFPDARFSLDRLKAISEKVGPERLVVDLRYLDE